LNGIFGGEPRGGGRIYRRRRRGCSMKIKEDREKERVTVENFEGNGTLYIHMYMRR